MAYPKDIKIIDTMMGILDSDDRSDWFASFRPLTKDPEALASYDMPAEYMFKSIPNAASISFFGPTNIEFFPIFVLLRITTNCPLSHRLKLESELDIDVAICTKVSPIAAWIVALT